MYMPHPSHEQFVAESQYFPYNRIRYYVVSVVYIDRSDLIQTFAIRDIWGDKGHCHYDDHHCFSPSLKLK